MRLATKILSLLFATAVVDAFQIPPEHAKCFGQCQVIVAGNATYAANCENEFASSHLPIFAAILIIRFSLRICLCNPNSPPRKAFVNCVETQCTPSDVQAVPTILDGLCTDSTLSLLSCCFISILRSSYPSVWLSPASFAVTCRSLPLTNLLRQLAEHLYLVPVLRHLLPLHGQAMWLLARSNLVTVVLLELPL